MKLFILIILFFAFLATGQSQYAPPAGQIGTTAIYKDSSVFVAWANSCAVIRGWQDVADTSLGKSFYGVDSNGVGVADNTVVSFGDGGVAILSFSHPIIDGQGADFAVFENGLTDSFLELAFVEVSSDSVHFIRFPATSVTDTVTQIGSFGEIDATKIHNFAGKYRALYGTPFDLSDLQDSAFLDIHNVLFVRIVDVIGTINDSLCTRDVHGNKVNDPYPTAFNTGGFDLDAVGVIHSNFQDISFLEPRKNIQIFPNPVSCNGKIFFRFISVKKRTGYIQIFNSFGQLIFVKNLIVNNSQQTINLDNWKKGVYVIKIETDEICFRKKIVVF